MGAGGHRYSSVGGDVDDRHLVRVGVGDRELGAVRGDGDAVRAEPNRNRVHRDGVGVEDGDELSVSAGLTSPLCGGAVGADPADAAPVTDASHGRFNRVRRFLPRRGANPWRQGARSSWAWRGQAANLDVNLDVAGPDHVDVATDLPPVLATAHIDGPGEDHPGCGGSPGRGRGRGCGPRRAGRWARSRCPGWSGRAAAALRRTAASASARGARSGSRSTRGCGRP